MLVQERAKEEQKKKEREEAEREKVKERQKREAAAGSFRKLLSDLVKKPEVIFVNFFHFHFVFPLGMLIFSFCILFSDFLFFFLFCSPHPPNFPPPISSGHLDRNPKSH